ncbi:MAG: MFS transporter [Nitrososphaerota archaeon]|nr:MFS transporter [Nitrososphaerota archaeon]
MLGIKVLTGLAGGMITVAFPFLILTNLHLGYLVLGEIYTASGIGTAILVFVMGIATDMLGRKASLLLAMSFLPLSCFLIVFSTNLGILFAAAIIGSFNSTAPLFGSGVGVVPQAAQQTITAELTVRKDRTFYYSLLSLGGSLSASLGALLSGITSTSELFLMATVLSAVSVVLSLFLKTVQSKRKSIKIKSSLAISKFTITGMLNGLSQGLVMPFLIPFFIAVYSLTRPEMAVYSGAAGFVGSFMILLAPRLERSLGFLKGIVVTRAITVVQLLIMPFVRILPLSIAIYILYPAFRALALPVQQSAMMDMVSADERGTAFGINQSTRLVAASAGTYFSGFEFALSEIEVPFLAYALTIAVNLGLYWKFFSLYVNPIRKNRKD